MTRLMGKGIHSKGKKSSTHKYANKIRNREKRRIQMQALTLEMHFQLRDQQLKTILHTYRLLHQNFRVTGNQKSTMDTRTNKKKQSKYNTKDSHQDIREQEKRGRKKSNKNPKQLIKWQ